MAVYCPHCNVVYRARKEGSESIVVKADHESGCPISPVADQDLVDRAVALMGAIAASPAPPRATFVPPVPYMRMIVSADGSHRRLFLWRYWNADGLGVYIVAVANVIKGEPFDWAAYIGANTDGCLRESAGVDRVVEHGAKIDRTIAETIFPEYAEKFPWRN